MKVASVADIKANFSAYVKASGHGPVVITRNGNAVAAPLGEDEDLERLMLGYSPKLRKILAASRARGSAGQALAHEWFWREVCASARSTRKRKTA